ncbi:MAG: oxidoreductase [Bacteroidetes bacterium SB0662_bin_6]|nr:oxidoreductase [Bacteroidetes bacterium SB0668_bin_1]MYE04503.1 oxidoreductase [Bacteroidetes bacterium SB0662_bin_6]
MKITLFLSFSVLLGAAACTSGEDGSSAEFVEVDKAVRLMTLDPGHFHAGLVHKYDYDQVDETVHIYAPDGQELESHLALIDRFNTRPEQPTHWVPVVYRGDDYPERMLEEKPGNVMVVAGNNGRKIEYIRRAVDAGIHVLADKPMVIHPDRFPVLKDVLASADEQGLLVNDIMTERHEITSILQRALSQDPDLFGELVAGSPEEPAISKESVHYFYKTVAGQPLVRPVWFFDVNQQGEAIADVTTHLVDLIMWQVFPEEPVDYENPDDGVEVITARSWDTPLTPSQFAKATREAAYPDYLAPGIENDSILAVAANGEFVFKVRGIHGKVSVRWGFENPEGGDTHYSIMRGTRANLVIRQDEAQQYAATLYVESLEGADPQEFDLILREALESLSPRYSGLSAEPSEFGWKINIPEDYKEGHEEHFTRVTEQYLQYLADGALPVWERTNLLTKYFITTQAYALSR